MSVSRTQDVVDILVLGSGGREHALLTKLAASSRAGKLWVAPGNGGMLQLAKQAPVNMMEPEEVAAWASKHNIGLVVIGPEAPLVAGVADATRKAGIPTFGPSAAAAQLEGSKAFAKRIMDKAGVPTARWKAFSDQTSCENYIRSAAAPMVIKADGLAAGKGVIIAQTHEEALAASAECFSGAFGAAGKTVVVEEFLEGPECSLFALSDGTHVIPLAEAQDHKRAYDGDKGPNTGGMGVYSPVPAVSDATFAEMFAMEERVVAAMAEEGIPFSGCLFGGFMLTQNGPYVLEFNVRFGDPEAEVIIPRLESDLLELLLATEEGRLHEVELTWSDDWAVSVVAASAGYPGSYETGKLISGIDEAEKTPDVTVYQAGTQLTEQDTLLTAGGRVLAVTGLGADFTQARQRAYAALAKIDFEGKQFRTDIGLHLQGALSDKPAVEATYLGVCEATMETAAETSTQTTAGTTVQTSMDISAKTSTQTSSDASPSLSFLSVAHNDALIEKPLAEEVAWKGRIFTVNRMQVELQNGKTAIRDVVRHPGAVAIVALTNEGKICLVRQFRAAIDRITLEIPAGKLDPGEDPLDCARRELKEETGFEADNIAFLTSIVSSGGFTDEIIHIYMATGLRAGAAEPDEDEFLQLELVEVSELVDAILDGKIEDAKTIIGALLCDSIGHRLSPTPLDNNSSQEV